MELYLDAVVVVVVVVFSCCAFCYFSSVVYARLVLDPRSYFSPFSVPAARQLVVLAVCKFVWREKSNIHLDFIGFVRFIFMNIRKLNLVKSNSLNVCSIIYPYMDAIVCQACYTYQPKIKIYMNTHSVSLSLARLHENYFFSFLQFGLEAFSVLLVLAYFYQFILWQKIFFLYSFIYFMINARHR